MRNHIGDDELVAEFQHNLKKANQDFLMEIYNNVLGHHFMKDIA